MTKAAVKITKEEEFEAQLPTPAGYKLLIALPKASDTYEGSRDVFAGGTSEILKRPFGVCIQRIFKCIPSVLHATMHMLRLPSFAFSWHPCL